MSRLNDLLRQLRMDNPALADDLQGEFDALADRRSFGLNFERHVPEAVELPGRKVCKGDKVRVLPPRGERRAAEHDRLWRVVGVTTEDGMRVGSLVSLDEPEDETSVPVDDLVVVAEFRDPIYPGLVSTGKVERGGDKPFHTVINAENFHALQTLLFTHRGKVDCIYIDPPYNTGAKDWKYNNDYVEGDDYYRHSKWLAFMERRLLLAKELLNPDDSVLIVTIDEKEYLRLGLLLEQVFLGASIQMVSSVTNPKGVVRTGDFARVNEYIYFVRFGSSVVGREPSSWGSSSDDEQSQTEIIELVSWQSLRRSDIDSARHGRTYRPRQFYPIYVNRSTGTIEEIGPPISKEIDRDSVPTRRGCDAVFPLRPDGTEIVWGVTDTSLRGLLAEGFVSSGSYTPDKPQPWGIKYLTSGKAKDVREGRARVIGHNPDGSVIAQYGEARAKMPSNQWRQPSHNAQHYGTLVNQAFIPGRRFPFPKSLYAVEDCLRLVLARAPDAIVLDFFAGSGTTAHALMRLNHEDHGRRQSILVTNNEVALDEQAELARAGMRPGDQGWEHLGICDHITKPRIEAAITGRTPGGEPVKGAYKFTDEFPMADGFEENVEFFTLTYEAPLRVASHREFARIAPLLWLRAGSEGRRIDDISDGWDVADAYAVIADLDRSEDFLKGIAANDRVRMAFIVTDEDRLFESIVAELPDHVEPVRLYEAYLRNFEIEAGRGAR